MSDELLKLMLGLQKEEEEPRNQYIRAPFSYPGAKTQSLNDLLPILPYRNSYIEPFGGSAAVLLARQPSKLEVYNDRYGGLVCFYRCLRDPTKWEMLVDRLDLTVHSREEFIWCRDTWEHDVKDDVERAARWYYMTCYSFNKKGWQFARATKSTAQFGKSLKNALKTFKSLNFRLRDVQIENLDWRYIIKDFSYKDSVIYCDPEYYSTVGMYNINMSKQDHIDLCEAIMKGQGFFALSGYDWPDHPYNNYDWTAKKSWEVHEKAKGHAFTESNNLEGYKERMTRDRVKETLWIKDHNA